jgi:hypothetical protein
MPDPLSSRNCPDGIKTTFATLIWLGGFLANAVAAELPLIRSGPGNEVPACVRPAELMAFVSNRNRGLNPPREIDPRLQNIGSVYQRIGPCVQNVRGECEGVRWDFAFFQMLIETNYLTFRKPDGSPGGVPAGDNNFAGIGATVAGKPGEKFKDIDTGVWAHLQHVLMYSGEKIVAPIAQRTRTVQSYVIAKMKKLGHPVTFADLATEWTGTDQSTYGTDIQRTAENFTVSYCR